MDPELLGDAGNCPCARSGSANASNAIRVARSRNSSGYLRGAAMNPMSFRLFDVSIKPGALHSGREEPTLRRALPTMPRGPSPSDVLAKPSRTILYRLIINT